MQINFVKERRDLDLLRSWGELYNLDLWAGQAYAIDKENKIYLSRTRIQKDFDPIIRVGSEYYIFLYKGKYYKLITEISEELGENYYQYKIININNIETIDDDFLKVFAMAFKVCRNYGDLDPSLKLKDVDFQVIIDLYE
ncbi:hypothetical protein [Psychrobacter sp. I-STPA10]|uniref:hypothetical protein n=1 Tax=Psychrobacter sp. I-STPA10 TaxID=2585769 RepID=UPI001E612DE0|nr:hypothetical protein [Psychrobacter sp. I-STPA10]